MARSVTLDITAGNMFSDPLTVGGPVGARRIGFSLGGTWSANVTLQRRFQGEVSWRDVSVHIVNLESVIDEAEGGVQYRFGVKTSDFISGTVEGRLGAED